MPWHFLNLMLQNEWRQRSTPGYFNSQHNWIPFHLLNSFTFLACCTLCFQCDACSLYQNHIYKVMISTLSTKKILSRSMLALTQREGIVTTSNRHEGCADIVVLCCMQRNAGCMRENSHSG